MPLEVAQCDGLTDKANLRCDLWIAPARVRGDCIWCIPAKRAINLPAISQRENAIIMPDHKWKDRRLGQLFIVPAAVCGPLLRRQQAKRWRRCDDSLHALAEAHQGRSAKFLGHAVICPDLLERRFPAKPLAEICPDRETRPQGRPVHRPVAATAVFTGSGCNLGNRSESFRETRRYQQRTAEGRSSEKL